MFYALGRFSERYRWPLLIGWITAAVVITLLAPTLEDVAANNQSTFLPEDSRAMQDYDFANKHFPQLNIGSNLTLVFHVEEGHSITDEAYTAYIAQISNWLVSEDAPTGITGVQSPTLNPEAAGSLISQDGQVAIVPISLGLISEHEQGELLSQVEAQLTEQPANLEVLISGEAAIYHDYNETIVEGADRTIWITLAMVVFILLTIYRSPVSPLIPLFVVTMAYLITRGIVAWLAETETFNITSTANVLLVVVMYGAGTDYCLFLISRFREELASQNNVQTAAHSTLRQVGESITSSAGTNITGFLAMATAQLGLFNTTGPALVIGIVLSLAAGLTLTPAILTILGKRAFWPSKAAHRDTGAFYKRTSQLVSSRPLLTIVVIVLIMAPFALYGSQFDTTYDSLADMPEETESVQGFRILEEHIGAGELQPLTLVKELAGDDLVAESAALTAQIMETEGVAEVRSASQPLGHVYQLLAEATGTADQLAMLAPMYLNSETNAARFEIILQDNPFSLSAMDTTLELRELFSETQGEYGIIGTTSVNAELRDILGRDMAQTIAIVLAGIFLVLTLMLRSLIAPLYLIGTILLSYGTTIGITRLASEALWGTDQLTWWVPFFMFVFLVALGIDYSIFLFGRIKEEVRQKGSQQGIHHAVAATGSIITSAGIIVAATFAGLMAGNILGLSQIGFAVSLGILIDTFVVRTILDPALATIFGKWTWWPGGIATLPKSEQEAGVLEASGAD